MAFGCGHHRVLRVFQLLIVWLVVVGLGKIQVQARDLVDQSHTSHQKELKNSDTGASFNETQSTDTSTSLDDDSSDATVEEEETKQTHTYHITHTYRPTDTSSSKSRPGRLSDWTVGRDSDDRWDASHSLDDAEELEVDQATKLMVEENGETTTHSNTSEQAQTQTQEHIQRGKKYGQARNEHQSGSQASSKDIDVNASDSGGRVHSSQHDSSLHSDDLFIAGQDSFLDDDEFWDEREGFWNEEELNIWLHTDLKNATEASSSKHQDNNIAEEVWIRRKDGNKTGANATAIGTTNTSTKSVQESDETIVVSSLRGAGSLEQDIVVPAGKKRIKQQVEFGSQDVFEEEIEIPVDQHAKRLKLRVANGVLHLLLEDDDHIAGNGSEAGNETTSRQQNDSTTNTNSSNDQVKKQETVGHLNYDTSSSIDSGIVELGQLINNTALLDDSDALSFGKEVSHVGFASALHRFEQDHGPLFTLCAVLIGVLVSVLAIGSLILARRAARVEIASVLAIDPEPDAEIHGEEEDETADDLQLDATLQEAQQQQQQQGVDEGEANVVTAVV